MINDNYILIQGWMINELGLKGTDLLVYAIIYGFSQDNENMYCGTRQYLADWCGCTVRSIQTSLNSLVEKEYITKYEEEHNHIKYVSYAVNFTTREKISLINNINNNTNNKLLSKDNNTLSKGEVEFDFGLDEKPKKKNLYVKCLEIIDEWTNDKKLKDLLVQYLDVCMEMKSIRGANQWKGMLNTLERVQEQCKPHTYEEIIEQATIRSWKTFYPIKDFVGSDNSQFIHIHKSSEYVEQTDDELQQAVDNDGKPIEY